MNKITMIGCDLHDRNTMLKVAVDTEKSVKKTFATADVAGMIDWIKSFAQEHGSTRIVCAYEASGRGFGLYDTLADAGIECHVLAPTHLPRTVHRRKNKTDEKDAEMILGELRGHLLAGRKLPVVWVPDPQTRDDREPVRMRLQLGAQRTRLKNQIRSLAKRTKLEFPVWFTSSGEWSRRSVQWLRDVAAGEGDGADGVRAVLASLMELYDAVCQQMKSLDRTIAKLAATPRYRRMFRKLKLMAGVGTLTAMVFLTELGDLDRFANRRQLSAYLGLTPTATESGEHNDRKGHITRQGPVQLRHMLCQAAWAALRCSDHWREKFERIKRGSPQRSKVAIVAIMRQLGNAMWRTARSANLDGLLDEADQKAWARAQQKEAAPTAVAVASSSAG